MPSALLLLTLSACESEEEIAAEMERALTSGNLALVGVLFAAETLSHTFEEPNAPTARHDPSACGACPCLERTGIASGPYTLSLDYGDSGCVPTSGLLPTPVSGHAVLAWDGATATLNWDGVLFGLEEPVAGPLAGEVADDGATLSLLVTGAPEIGGQAFDLAVDLALDAERLAIDGTVKLPGDPAATLVFEEVSLPLLAIGAPCATPEAGRVRLRNPDDPDKDVVIDFAKPGDGRVKVQRDDRVSEAVDWCAYKSALL